MGSLINIPLSLPNIEQEEKESVLSVLNSNWLIHGQYNEDFEKSFSDYIGVKHAISMNSCTSALEIALIANGIKGEVIVPSFTFVASANAIVTAGATPVFCDVDIKTRNTTINHIEACVTNRTEAVIVVHFAGQPCAMDEISNFCIKKGLLLIEDSAETLGATWDNKQAGSYGLGCFSFFPTKNMTTGEGGMLTCNNDNLAETARTLISHGISKTTFAREKTEKPWFRSASAVGRNLRMPNILAAIGYHQLKKLDIMNKRRVELANIYSSKIIERELPIEPPFVKNKATHVYQMYTVLSTQNQRNQLVKDLRSNGIGASVHFDPPVHLMPLYSEDYPCHSDLPNTQYLCQNIFTLPLFPTMKESQVMRVIEMIEKVSR